MIANSRQRISYAAVLPPLRAARRSATQAADLTWPTIALDTAAAGRPMWARGDGGATLYQHGGQQRAMASTARFVAVLAGLQSGKTSWGPWWLAREIAARGPGDYIAATASYDLFKLKMLPALREVFEDALGVGRYWPSDRLIELAPSPGAFQARRAGDKMWGRIILRSAESGGGMESATAKGAWLDEAGQDSFTGDTWHAVRGRVSLATGRVLFTTTLYNFGWLKTEIYDVAQRGDADYAVIAFDSTENPVFPQAEFDQARATMPGWKFAMRYRGQYDRPAGLIYDSLDADRCVVPRFTIPADWQRYMGLDFGGVHTAAVFYAEEPGTKRLFAYREYLAGGRSAAEHVRALLAGEPMVPFCCGGSKSEGQWRTEFRRAGLPVGEPDISEVEVGIGRVYAQHAQQGIVVFDDLAGYLDQKRRYSRVLDANGDPTEAIEHKSTYHYLDAERYIIGRIRPTERP